MSLLESALKKPSTLTQFLKICGLTWQQFQSAQDGQIINRCLILKNAICDTKFCNDTTFEFVCAPKLRFVQHNQFRAVNLKSVFMPLVEEVGGFAFLHSHLSNFNFFSLQGAGNSSFSENQFENVFLPRFSVFYAQNCFQNCLKLQFFVALGLKIIFKDSFQNCTQLKIVIAPEATIQENAFFGCDKLHTVLVASGEYRCVSKCGVCPQCLNQFKTCIENGNKLKQTQEYQQLEKIESFDEHFKQVESTFEAQLAKDKQFETGIHIKEEKLQKIILQEQANQNETLKQILQIVQKQEQTIAFMNNRFTQLEQKHSQEIADLKKSMQEEHQIQKYSMGEIMNNVQHQQHNLKELKEKIMYMLE